MTKSSPPSNSNRESLSCWPPMVMSSLERNIPIWKTCSGACLRDWWSASRTNMATVASDGWGKWHRYSPFTLLCSLTWYVCVCVCLLGWVLILKWKVHGVAGEAVVSWWMRKMAKVLFCHLILQPEVVCVCVCVFGWLGGGLVLFEIQSTWSCWRSSSEPASCSRPSWCYHVTFS